MNNKIDNIKFKLVNKKEVKDPSEISNYEKINDSEEYKVYYNNFHIGTLWIRYYVDHEYFQDCYHFQVNEKLFLKHSIKRSKDYVISFPQIWVKSNDGFTHDDIKTTIIKNLSDCYLIMDKNREKVAIELFTAQEHFKKIDADCLNIHDLIIK